MFKTKFKIQEEGDITFSLLEDLVYKGKYDTFTVPAGFVTDFASVPRFFTWLLPTYGRYTKAAMVHDWLCVQLGRAWRAELSEQRVFVRAPVNSVDTDGIFRRIMEELGVPFFRRWLLWCGVRWGAIANPARRAGSLDTLPKVLLVSLLALPLIIPTIFVMIGQLIDKLVEAL